MTSKGYYIPNSSNNSYNYDLRRTDKMMSEKKYSNFTENVQNYYLSEALSFILDKCIGESTVEATSFGKNICRRFVQEEGYYNLMRKFRTGTCTLALVEECVSEAVDETIKRCDQNDCLTWTIKDVDNMKFFNSLKNLSLDKLTKKINDKVCCAAEEFVQKNVTAKADIEDAAAKAKERIAAAKAKLDEKKAKQVEESENMLYRQEVNRIKFDNPIRSIYEHMMITTSKAAMENEKARGVYLSESGEIKMGDIESQVQIMYTFLEMVNSLRIKKVDNKYIEEALSSIQ